VRIGYSLGMQYSSKRTYVYNENYHLQRFYDDGKNIKLLVYRCDICNDDLVHVPDNFEENMKVINEIDNSYESEYDKSTFVSGPKLLLCDYCKNEYKLPSYR
jgi:hypothetical protein